MCRGGRVLALPSLCFCSCLEGELPWLGAVGCCWLQGTSGLCRCRAPWVLCMDFLGRCPLPQPCLRAVLTQILMEDATWLWAESEGVSARADPRDLRCFGGSLPGLGALQFPQTQSLQAGAICQPWEEMDPAPAEPLLTEGSPREPINLLPWFPPRDCQGAQCWQDCPHSAFSSLGLCVSPQLARG